MIFEHMLYVMLNVMLYPDLGYKFIVQQSAYPNREINVDQEKCG